MSPLSRKGLSFAANYALAGGSFTLAFGWLWFPALRSLLLPELIARGLRPLPFGLGLCAGFLLYSLFVARRMAVSGRASPRAQALLTHAVAFTLSGASLLFLCPEWRSVWLPTGAAMAVGVAALAGFGVALPGVWWLCRVLAFGPSKAVAGLAFAASAALAAAAVLHGLPVLPAFLPWVPAAGIVLAGLFTLVQARSAGQCAGADSTSGYEALACALYPEPPFFSMQCLQPMCGIAALFFGLGALSVIVPAAQGLTPVAAHACGLILAAALLSPSPDWWKLWPGRLKRWRQANGAGPADAAASQSGSALGRCRGFAVFALAVPSLCLPFLDDAGPRFHTLCYAATALPEAAALAMCAALPQGASGSRFFWPANAPLAGLFLLLALSAGNLGYLAGWELIRLTGKAGPALPGLLTALLFALAAYREKVRKGEGSGGAKPVQESKDPHRPEPVGTAAATAEEPAGEPAAKGTAGEPELRPKTALQLTRREQALAALLVQGHSNREIGEILGLSENTVRWYIKKLYKKTGAADRTILIAALGGGAL